VTESLSLISMPSDVRELCRQADISSKSTLLQIVRQTDPEKMRALVEKMVEHGPVTRQALRAATAKPRKTSKNARPYVFAFRPPTKSFQLRMSFSKTRVDKTEIIEALENIVRELRASK